MANEKKTRFAILHLGSLDIPRAENVKPDPNDPDAQDLRLSLPIYAILIQHKTLGNILFDTGIALDWRQTWSDHYKKTYWFNYEYNLIERLRECGLTVEDIDKLIISHMHFDHTGNIRLFAGLKAGKAVMISEPEARHAFYEVNAFEDGYVGAYNRREFCAIPGIKYDIQPAGDIQLADDLMLIAQTGHTPQVYGLLIKTEGSGNFILTSDGVHNHFNWGPPIQLPGLCKYPEEYKKNVERLHQMAKEYNARVLLGHDFDNFNEFKVGPFFYE